MDASWSLNVYYKEFRNVNVFFMILHWNLIWSLSKPLDLQRMTKVWKKKGSPTNLGRWGTWLRKGCFSPQSGNKNQSRLDLGFNEPTSSPLELNKVNVLSRILCFCAFPFFCFAETWLCGSRHDLIHLKTLKSISSFHLFVQIETTTVNIKLYKFTNTCICVCLCVFFVFVWLSSCHCLFPCKFQRHYSSRRPSMHQSVLFHDQRTDKARVSVAGHLKNKCNFHPTNAMRVEDQCVHMLSDLWEWIWL